MPVSKHHLIPRSRKDDGFDTRGPTNIKKIENRTHENIHRLFDNMTPDEQINSLLDLNDKVIEPTTLQKIKGLLRRNIFYKQEVLKILLLGL